MEHVNRRQFLSRSLLGAAALSMTSRRVLGANERVNIALIGCGGRGRIVTRGLIEHGAQVTYLCDLHEERLETTAKEIAGIQGSRPKKVKQMRQVFDSKDVDAVMVGTPDHWHTPASILACQAGKDVYVEKPHSHNLWESRKLIEAARKYRRIVQVGTQNRSAPYNHAARQYIKAGKLGKISLVKVYNMKPGGPFRLGEPGTPPAGFDWDAWLGTAPQRPYHQRIFHGGWHKFWDFSGGRMAHKGDDAQTPDLQIITFEFDDFVMTFELTGYPRYMRKTTGTIRRNDEFPYWTQNATRIELYGSERMMTVGRHGGGWQVTTSGGKVVEQMYGRFPDAPHQQNFIECVKSRKPSNADVEILHKSCALVHLGNIAHRVGNRSLRFDAATEQFIDDAEANKLLKREGRGKYEIPKQV